MNLVKEIRQTTGLSQVKFAEKYGIPVQTMKSWESNPGSTAYRPVPQYIADLLQTAVESEIRFNSINNKVNEINAVLSQYARSDGYNLSLEEANQLIHKILEVSMISNQE